MTKESEGLAFTPWAPYLKPLRSPDDGRERLRKH